MRVLALTLIRNDDFALIRIDILILVSIIKAKKDAVCLTIIKYKGNRRNNYKAFE